jgi:hypothetical protein
VLWLADPRDLCNSRDRLCALSVTTYSSRNMRALVLYVRRTLDLLGDGPRHILTSPRERRAHGS